MKKRRIKATRATLRNTDIIAGTKLSLRKLQQLIACFARKQTPREAIESTGLSHVTVYRFYGQLRRRLCDVGIYQTKEQFIRRQTEVDEETDSYFGLAGFSEFIKKELGKHRGFRKRNLPFYEAEAVHRYDTDLPFVALRLVILHAIAEAGPINRPAQPFNPASMFKFTMEAQMIGLRILVRRSGEGAHLAKFELALLQDIINNVEDFMRQQARVQPRKLSD